MQDASTDFLIIGGGILGAATAWSLAQRAPVGTRIRLIEAGMLASATTSQAAALLTRVRPDPAMAALVAETFVAIEQLNAVLDQSLPLRQVGSLHLASHDAGKSYLRETWHTARSLGLKAEWLDGKGAQSLAPWLAPGEGSEALFVAEDGYMDPVQLAQGYFSAARKLGVEVMQNCRVEALIKDQERVLGARTSNGDIIAGTVICCAGPWSVKLLAESGIQLPMAPVRSHYWITEDNTELFLVESPMVILPDANAYARPEVGGLLFGLRDQQAVYGDPAGLPEDIHGYLFNCDPEGWECLESGWTDLAEVFPAIEHLGVAHYLTGVSSYTPDGKPLLGRTALAGLLVATGCSGGGIALSGGIGRLLAELALEQSSYIDTTPFAPERFGPVDPFSEAFRIRCALARSQKRSG
ncbi:NAD(P)/FAD-dependent oxidoreductase [Marinobacterium sediminicola]|uniref:4-methylaminobutanoate oxidase (Formaldehyde-forming) n=1 Tax=Marinobacterium sediminicola TaxID=518898 RepID=A0ABY1RYI4_9GAMM|nr:FAD-dependent oxidoreductase [Marinobacterium sediminicola]ULG68123.1 FAD-binding oxidoreductase [Marinobacterium sediminicola]SMR73364.1 4-methylaminobutanoate oxidase (formaldehyde-forming) [Marinobacterium sediminicola]